MLARPDPGRTPRRPRELRLHARGIEHCGIVYAHQRTPIGDVIRGLSLIYQILDNNNMQDHIEFL